MYVTMYNNNQKEHKIMKRDLIVVIELQLLKMTTGLMDKLSFPL